MFLVDRKRNTITRSCALTQLWRLAPFAVELERVPWNTTWTVGHALGGGLHSWNCRTIVARRI
jgi:hypothetical protein